MDAPALRPLAVGEVLDVAIKIYRAHFLTLVKTVLVVVAPLQVLTVLVQVSSRPSPEQLTTVGPNGQPQVHFGAFRTVIAGTFVVVVLSFAVSQLAAAASFKAVSTAYLGETPSWRASLRFAVSKLHSLLWLALMSITLAVLALFLCIVPGVRACVRQQHGDAYALAAVGAAGAGLAAALSQSFFHGPGGIAFVAFWVSLLVWLASYLFVPGMQGHTFFIFLIADGFYSYVLIKNSTSVSFGFFGEDGRRGPHGSIASPVGDPRRLPCPRGPGRVPVAHRAREPRDAVDQG